MTRSGGARYEHHRISPAPLGSAGPVPKTVPMTQRVELATVMDRLAVDELVTEYAVAVDDGDWAAYRGLFTTDGRADYRSAGGIEGDAGQVAGWLAESLALFSMRQHLIVNRRVRFGTLDHDTGDTARLQADYINPMRFAGGDGTATAPDFVCGGRYAFTLLRTGDGWRLRRVVVEEKWRRLPDGRAVAGSD
ncbi:SnoaL-like protein [Streptomyces sp. Ag109_O5-1]|nr:SnoaL-like protein [Streptomyces sp. Ag109_O5-1]